MNALDRVVGYFSPAVAARRAHYRRVLAYYEAGTPSRLRKNRTAPGTGNLSVHKAGRTLREQARYYEQNHDLARGVLAELVAKTIGPYGITVEPQPRLVDGSIHDDFAQQLLSLYRDWEQCPEVTWCHDWPSAQRLLARSWFRDGDVFAQLVQGNVSNIDHGTQIPLSLEMLEADLVPFEYSMPPGIIQGVELNGWGRATGFWVLKQPPGDVFQGFAILPTNLKRIPAERMLWVKTIDRIRQIRGVSHFAAVLNRLDDLKDYEESERIAAKVAASMAAFIKKGAPESYEGPADGDESSLRELKFRPGMVFDDLRPGEEIGMIDTSRPNQNLLSYRQGQLRAAAAGTGTSYSSIAKDYNGTYSAQRQELVESYANYQILQGEFTARIVRPTYQAAVRLAIAAGLVKVPKEVVAASVDDAIYVGPQMPWIDPEAETKSWMQQEGAVYTSGPEIIRRRGANPRDVLAQEASWQKKVAAAGLAQQLQTGGGGFGQQQGTPAQPVPTPAQPTRKGAA